MIKPEAILVRERVAQRTRTKSFLHEYQCPSCGTKRIATAHKAKNSPLCQTCGTTKHGMSYDLRYRAWNNMRQRCISTSRNDSKNYSLRGISICREWNTFDGFASWEKFGEWKPGLQIDRIDNSKGYSPGNCRWATRSENTRNRRCTKLAIEDVRAIRLMRKNGMRLREIAEIFSVSEALVSRIYLGKTWLDEEESARGR